MGGWHLAGRIAWLHLRSQLRGGDGMRIAWSLCSATGRSHKAKCSLQGHAKRHTSCASQQSRAGPQHLGQWTTPALVVQICAFPAAANVTGTEISIGASLTESVNLSKLSVLFIGFVLRLALRVGTSSVMRLALGGLAFENRWLLLRCI